ncbi:MAG: two-component system, OmpR family, sensor histidine kinase BaeS [Actinomycetota bacterium]|nr:two-component system, OmpR family, sensor histidine kinase BaeS [Actinomycetota bacterium]
MRFRRWASGFRARIALLIAIVISLTAGATALLTVRQATQQVTNSAVVAEQDIGTIEGRIADFGGLSKNWDGVGPTVEALAKRTGQRIQLTTDTGEVVADSDILSGGRARPVSRQARTVVDPRPNPPFTTGGVPELAQALLDYQRDLDFTSCITVLGGKLTAVRSALGTPTPDYHRMTAEPSYKECLAKSSLHQYSGVIPGPVLKLVDGCHASSKVVVTTSAPPPQSDITSTTRPASPDGTPDNLLVPAAPAPECLQQVFRELSKPVLPPVLFLSVGVGDRPQATITPWPALIVATLVAIIAIFGTVLLSRRVLQPIGTLTRASRHLGAGDLTERVPVRGHDELSELATSFNRMAESLQASKEQQRNMVADIAHELRTPLANIRGYLEALKDGVLKPDNALFVSLYEEALLQQRLIDDLQDLALAESGTMIYHRTRLDAGELLNTIRTAHSAAAESRGLHLEVYVYQRPVIDGDPERLRQVIGNLLTNAMRATAAGGSIKLRAQIEQDDVVIEVADTGSGIEPEDLEHVFDRFWRADNARSRSTGGSGLGLAIAREIVAAHEGSLTVTSTVDIGTVCTIRLPRH